MTLPMAPVIVRSYRAKKQEEAAQLFAHDALALAAQGYFPVSQSWAEGRYDGIAFLAAIVLFLFVLGIFVLAYMLIVKPDGTLSVTFSYQPERTTPDMAALAAATPKPAGMVTGEHWRG